MYDHTQSEVHVALDILDWNTSIECQGGTRAPERMDGDVGGL